MADHTAPEPTSTGPSSMWIDPDSEVPSGILLSDRIRFYVETTNLISPFSEDLLGPASYALTLGAEYWDASNLSGDPPLFTLESGQTLTIPPNSIVFVSTRETLNIPFYIAARFNLKLRLLYEGLLVGAGPQVDPGFRGRLSCPLHNISSQPIRLNAGETFAVIDFAKTTPFAEQEALTTDTISLEKVREQGESKQLKGKHGMPCLTFPRTKLDREPVKGYLPVGKIVSSSVAGLEKSTKENETKINEGLKKLDNAVNRINLISFITVIVVAVSLGTYFYAAINWTRSMRDDAVNLSEKNSDVRFKQEKESLESQIRALEKRLEKLENSQQSSGRTISGN
jgi:deoxycytidine triphosphate deaminase